MVATKRLTFFTAGYSQVAMVFPFVVASPAYFTGRIPLGGLTQTANAFGEVQGALSWFVDNYASLTEWRATVKRITGFLDAIDAARGATAAGTGVQAAAEARGDLALEGMTLTLPDGRMLLEGAAARIQPGEAVLVAGPSGSGKSTLFRAIAGIWPFGAGRVRVPAGASVLFLPQRPYLPLGTLHRAVCYPRDDHRLHRGRGAGGADRCRARPPGGAARGGGCLGPAPLGRRAAARGARPRPAAEARLAVPRRGDGQPRPGGRGAVLCAAEGKAAGTTLVSIAHRPAVAQYHQRALRLRDGQLVAGSI